MQPALPPVLLFDLDDTLVTFSASGDFWPVAFEAQSKGRVGVEAARFSEAITRVSTPFWSDPQRAVQGRLDLIWARRQVARLAFAELGLGTAYDALAHAIADDYTWRKEDAVTPFEGAVDTLTRLRDRGVRLALITNGHSEFQRRKLTRHALEPHFDAILVEGEFGVGKPHERIFREALRRMRVSPDHAWMVGDNLHADVAGAQACGIHAVWHDYARSGLPANSAIVPQRIIHSVRELLDPKG